MSIDQVVNAIGIAIDKLPYMESLYGQAKDQAEKKQRTRQGLANDIAGLERKISLLDKTAFSCEQECKRKEQSVQELAYKKERIEKFIANILNGEVYSKLNQIAKESVKVVLSENTKLISISFVALIQTLKADPEMLKLIQHIPGANDDKQHKDNNSITKYLEFNKDRILTLTEKNYENLVEALTNNVISTAAGAASSSSNPPPSLPSSSALLGPYNKSDTYITEKEEMFHNSKGDIAD
jgi:hypothetical protein